MKKGFWCKKYSLETQDINFFIRDDNVINMNKLTTLLNSLLLSFFLLIRTQTAPCLKQGAVHIYKNLLNTLLLNLKLHFIKQTSRIPHIQPGIALCKRIICFVNNKLTIEINLNSFSFSYHF